MSIGSPPHALPDVGGEERRRDVDPLVQNQIAIFVLPRRHPRRVGGHRQNFFAVHETVERGIGGPDMRLLGERIELGRRGIELHDRRRIGPSERVVDQDRKQVGIGRRLHVEMMMLNGASLRPRPQFREPSYNCERGPRTRPSSS